MLGGASAGCGGVGGGGGVMGWGMTRVGSMATVGSVWSRPTISTVSMCPGKITELKMHSKVLQSLVNCHVIFSKGAPCCRINTPECAQLS